MNPLVTGLIGGGVGLVKSLFGPDEQKRQAMQRAAEIRASPWTGKGPTTEITAGPKNPFGEMLQYGSAGLQLGQNYKAADLGNQLAKAKLDYFQSMMPKPSPSQASINPLDGVNPLKTNVIDNGMQAPGMMYNGQPNKWRGIASLMG